LNSDAIPLLREQFSGEQCKKISFRRCLTT